MARVRVMYWKEIPVQVQAQDERGQVSVPLDARFQQAADSIAMCDGSAGGEAYLAAWEWGPFIEAPGSAANAATMVVEKYNTRFPKEVVAIVTDLQWTGRRDPRPGALDHLMGQDLALEERARRSLKQPL